MAKQCLVDGKKIGAMTGFIKTADGDYVCRPHWKEMGFNTTSDAVKYGQTISTQNVRDILDSGMKGRDYLSQASGRTARESKIKQDFEAAGVSDLWGTRKEVGALPDIIHDDETVKYATSGIVDGNTILMVCTNERIIFIDKGLVYGIKSTEIPLNMVNAISYSKGMLLGNISITNGATVTAVKDVNKQTAPVMVDAVNAARKTLVSQPTIQQPAQEIPDAADELRKFKSLLDDGIISQEDFDAKKKQLLGL